MKNLLLFSCLFAFGLATLPSIGQIQTTSIGKGDQPSIATTSSGLIGITYGEGKDIFFVSSRDGGNSFSKPEKVATHPGLILGMSSGPQLTMSDEAYVIIAPDRKGNLSLWRKLRTASQWEGPYRVNDLAGSAGENLVAVAFDDDGKTLYATWIDTRREGMEHAGRDRNTHSGGHEVKEREAGGKEKVVKAREPEREMSHDMPAPLTQEQLMKEIGEMPEGAKGISQYQGMDGKMYWVVLDAEGNALKAKDMDSYKKFKERNAGRSKPQGKIFVAKSTDYGKTWTRSTMVYASPDGSVCECCKPSIISSGNDLYIMFRNNVNGMRDLYLTKSVDKAKSFTQPEKLGVGSWQINGCPMDGGSIEVTARGVVTAWQREGVVYTAVPGLPERSLGQGRAPVVTSTARGEYFFWYQAGKIVGKTPTSPMQLTIGTGSSFRSLATKAGEVLGVWVQEGKVVSKKIS